MHTTSINITLDELSWLNKGLTLVEKKEIERDELLSNLHTKLVRAIRELASQ